MCNVRLGQKENLHISTLAYLPAMRVPKKRFLDVNVEKLFSSLLLMIQTSKLKCLSPSKLLEPSCIIADRAKSCSIHVTSELTNTRLKRHAMYKRPSFYVFNVGDKKVLSH